MTTIRQLVTDAYRESGIIQSGTVADTEQLDEGFRKLQSLISNLYGNEMGSPFEPVSYGKNGLTNAYALEEDRKPFLQDTYVHPNFRLYCNLTEDTTVFLAPNPVDGTRFAVADMSKNFATNNLVVNANGRLIDGEPSITLDTDGLSVQWFFRADIGTWQKVSPLTLDDQSPFPAEFDDMLTTKLAMRLNPRFLVQTAPEIAMEFKEANNKFKARYRAVQEVTSELSLRRLSQNNYFDDYTDFNGVRFNKGLVY